MVEDGAGYKKPPQKTRWAKGQSGNPKGRAKGQKNFKTDLQEELRELVQITEAGVSRRITRQRAVVKSLIARAISGDARIMSLFLDMLVALHDAEGSPQSAPVLEAGDEALIADFLRRNVARQGAGSSNEGEK